MRMASSRQLASALRQWSGRTRLAYGACCIRGSCGSRKGDRFDLDLCLDSNCRGPNHWYAQELREPTVRVVGCTAVLRVHRDAAVHGGGHGRRRPEPSGALRDAHDADLGQGRGRLAMPGRPRRPSADRCVAALVVPRSFRRPPGHDLVMPDRSAASSAYRPDQRPKTYRLRTAQLIDPDERGAVRRKFEIPRISSSARVHKFRPSDALERIAATRP